MTYSEVLEFSVYVLLDPRKVVAFEYEIAGTGEFIKFEYQPFYVGKGRAIAPEITYWRRRLAVATASARLSVSYRAWVFSRSSSES